MESPADDSNARESSVPVALEPGCSALLLAPSNRQDADARCVAAAVSTRRRSVRALTISVNHCVTTVLDRWRAHADYLPVETAVVTVGDGTRSAAVSNGAGELQRLRSDVGTTSVSDASDPEGLVFISNVTGTDPLTVERVDKIDGVPVDSVDNSWSVVVRKENLDISEQIVAELESSSGSILARSDPFVVTIDA